MISVAYHLVRSAGSGWLSGVPAMDPDELERQLRWLRERRRMLTPEELYDAVARGSLPADGCVLTFDDGYIGQREHALPILRRLGLRAFFFVPTMILEERTSPIVEKQRVLQYARWPYPEFYDRFCQAVRATSPEVPAAGYEATPRNLSAATGYYAEYAFYTPLERLFRQVRETVLSGEQFDAAIESLFRSGYDEQEFVARYFMSWRDVDELVEAGMEIGGHGHHHLIDTAVSPETATADAATCLAILTRRLARPVRSYCYPYGIYRSETVATVRDAGISAGFTCRPGEDRDGSFLLLDRIDCRSAALA